MMCWSNTGDSSKSLHFYGRDLINTPSSLAPEAPARSLSIGGGGTLQFPNPNGGEFNMFNGDEYHGRIRKTSPTKNKQIMGT